MTAIFVDADACPVKAEVEQVAMRHKVQIYIVSNGGVRLSQTRLFTLSLFRMGQMLPICGLQSARVRGM